MPARDRSRVSTRVDGWVKRNIGLPPVADFDAWYDASDLSTINHTSDAVISWSDKTGKGPTLYATPAATRPTTNTASQNGLNAIRFDGSNDVLVGTMNNVAVLEVSLFMVMKVVAGGNNQDMFCSVGASGTLRRLRCLFRNTNATSLGYGTWGNDIATSTLSLDINGAYHFFGAVNTSTTGVTLVRDGSTETGTLGSTILGLDFPYVAVSGVLGNTSYPAQIDVGEVLIYLRTLTADEITATWNYAQAKWAL